MSTLILVKPLSPISVQVTTPGMERMLTPDPKEAFFFPDDALDRFIEYDFGAPVSVDSLFAGYHNALADQLVAIQRISGFGDTGGSPLYGGQLQIAPKGFGPPYHAFYRFGVDQPARYWRVRFNNNGGGGNWHVGVIAVGIALQMQFGEEWGGGRSIDDTGTVERLFGGGFAIDEGVSAGGYQWSFGDLQDDEVRQLYQLVKERRTTRSILVVEDPDQTDGLNERIHWGLFRKLDVYERRDVGNTRWALQVQDWA